MIPHQIKNMLVHSQVLSPNLGYTTLTHVLAFILQQNVKRIEYCVSVCRASCPGP